MAAKQAGLGVEGCCLAVAELMEGGLRQVVGVS